MSSSESDQAAIKQDEGRPSERPPSRASTIIVDPELMAEAERLSESQRPKAPVEGSPIEGSEGEAEGGEPEQLSVEEAERFATAFRASWEPMAPTGNGHAHASSGSPSNPAPGPVMPAAVGEPIPPPVLVSQLPGARRGRTLALGAAAFAGFLAIALLGWLASNSGVPEHPGSVDPLAASPSAAKPQPAEAAPEPASEQRAAPAQPSAPAEPAAQAAPAETKDLPAEATAPPAAAPTPAVVAEPVPAPALVALQITTRPGDARLVLDGAPVPNPYEAMHPQGGSHVVEATAPGYRAQNLTIELTRKRSVALELEKERIESAPSQAAAKAPAPRPKRPRPERVRKPDTSSSKGAAFTSESPY